MHRAYKVGTRVCKHNEKYIIGLSAAAYTETSYMLRRSTWYLKLEFKIRVSTLSIWIADILQTR